MYPRSLSSILARATLWCLKAAPSFELVVSRAPCTAVCAASSASRVRAPCVVLSPSLSVAHAAAAGAEPRANVPRVRLTCSRARTESRPIEACSGKRAAYAGAHQLLLRPRELSGGHCRCASVASAADTCALRASASPPRRCSSTPPSRCALVRLVRPSVSPATSSATRS